MSVQAEIALPAGVKRDPIRVMVVDDAVVARGLISRWLNEEPGIEVVSRQSNGVMALANISRCRPDVVLLDIDMPEMDGVTALPLMLKACPSAKIVMCSTLSRRNAEISLRALRAGAVDCIAKPGTNSGVTTSTEFRREIVAKVLALGAGHMASAARRIPAVPAHAPQIVGGAALLLRPFSVVRPEMLAIGSSTGGPQALLELLPAVAKVLPLVPVVIAQHMPPTFTTSMAEHLAAALKRPVREAGHGEMLVPGTVYVAPGGRHLKLARENGMTVALLDDGPPVNYCKPAVDVLFDSIAGIYGPAALALVLTGMGHDGRDGARRIANAGGSVIAQDEASSVVWGMPAAAARAGVCCAVLPLGEIAARVETLIEGCAA